MPIKKYINTAEVAELTGLQQKDIRILAKTNVLPSHKTRKGHYRFNVDAVEDASQELAVDTINEIKQVNEEANDASVSSSNHIVLHRLINMRRMNLIICVALILHLRMICMIMV